MRRALCAELRDLHAVPIENLLAPGTPDVAMVGAWVELKYLPAWPRRHDTIVRVRKWTPAQQAWLVTHERRGGGAFVLLRVDRDWLLFFATDAARLLNRSNECQLRQGAAVVATGAKLPHELCHFFRARCSPTNVS